MFEACGPAGPCPRIGSPSLCDHGTTKTSPAAAPKLLPLRARRLQRQHLSGTCRQAAHSSNFNAAVLTREFVTFLPNSAAMLSYRFGMPTACPGERYAQFRLGVKIRTIPRASKRP